MIYLATITLFPHDKQFAIDTYAVDRCVGDKNYFMTLPTPILFIVVLTMSYLRYTQALVMSSSTHHLARKSPFISFRKDRFPLPTASTRVMSSSASNAPPTYPRAAVSVVIRCQDRNFPSSSTSISSMRNKMVRYLLVSRGNEPNKGMWSFPGGKIETNEGTMAAAKRELREETGLGSINNPHTLKWYNDGAFACSDAIADGFHYVISQCFVEVIAKSEPQIEASDDAMDAKWWTTDQVEVAEANGIVSPGVLKVLKRSEQLYENGLLK